MYVDVRRATDIMQCPRCGATFTTNDKRLVEPLARGAQFPMPCGRCGQRTLVRTKLVKLASECVPPGVVR